MSKSTVTVVWSYTIPVGPDFDPQDPADVEIARESAWANLQKSDAEIIDDDGEAGTPQNSNENGSLGVDPANHLILEITDNLRSAGVTSGQLDSIIYDDMEAKTLRATSHLTVHERDVALAATDEAASRINSQGLRGQVSFLLTRHGAKKTLRKLRVNLDDFCPKWSVCIVPIHKTSGARSDPIIDQVFGITKDDAFERLENAARERGCDSHEFHRSSFAMIH